MRPHGDGAQIANIVLVLVTGLMVALLAMAAWVCAFDSDEFQHLETAWLIANGAIPYRDFFEHHTPLYYFLIAPLLTNPQLTTSGDAAVHMVLRLRLLAVAFDAGILGLVYGITRKLAGRMEAFFACALLATSIIFIQKGIEIRPDQLAAILLLASTLLLTVAMDSKKWPWLLAAAGIATALAILTTQKILLTAPGLAVSIFIVCIQHHLPKRKVVKAFFLFAIFAVAATLPLLFYFWTQNALANFLIDNFFLGVKWKHIASTIPWIFSLIGREDALLILLAAIGFTECLRQKREMALRVALILAPLFSMLIFIPLFPVVQRQYIFLFYPYAAILGGMGAATLMKYLAEQKYRMVQPALILPVVIGLHGISLMGHEFSQRNDATLAKLRYVVGQTAPSDTVMPAWSPGIAFRKPAFFYPVLHEEIRPLITPPVYAALLANLKNRNTSPVLIDMDQDMQQLPPDIVDTLKKGWQPTGVGTLWRRRQDVAIP